MRKIAFVCLVSGLGMWGCGPLPMQPGNTELQLTPHHECWTPIINGQRHGYVTNEPCVPGYSEEPLYKSPIPLEPATYQDGSTDLAPFLSA